MGSNAAPAPLRADGDVVMVSWVHVVPEITSNVAAAPDRAAGLVDSDCWVHVVPFQVHVSCSCDFFDAPPKRTTMLRTESHTADAFCRAAGELLGESFAHVVPFHTQVSFSSP